MSETVERKLYSPLQVDIIDRDSGGHAIPLEAVKGEEAKEYLGRIMAALREAQPQEDARNAFTAPDQDWSEVCEKIISLTRAVEVVGGRLYGVYTCRSRGGLDPEELESLEWYCQERWAEGWGEGYAHCPREGASLGLYIHYWQEEEGPLLAREGLEAGPGEPAVQEINQDTFWTLIGQAKECRPDMACEWLARRLMSMGPEQAKKFDDIANAYKALAYQFGLWGAASIMCGGCTDDGFIDFRGWLVGQGRDVYMAALKDPDSLASMVDCQDFLFDGLARMGDLAYERLTGQLACQDFDPGQYQALEAELKRGIEYGEGINYPYDQADLPAYVPKLCAKYLAPGQIRELAQTRGCTWNLNSAEIQAARRGQKSRRVRTAKKRGGECR